MSYMTVGDSGIATKIGGALKGAIDFFGKSQADAAVADLARQQAAAQTAAAASIPPPSGFPILPIVLVAGAGVLALVLLKKKKT